MACDDFLRRLLVGAHEQELVLDGKIPVDPRQKPFHMIDTQVRFQGVTASGRRHRPQGVTLFHTRPDPLGRPEQKAQLIQRHGFPGIDTAALSVPDGLREIDRRDVLPLAEFGQVDPDRVRREWLFDRRWGNAPILIGLREIDLLADAVLQEIAKLVPILLCP